MTMTVTMSVLLQGRRVLSRGHGRWEGRWGSRLGSRCVLLREAGSQHAGPPGRAGAQEVRKESAQGGGALPGLFAVFCHF